MIKEICGLTNTEIFGLVIKHVYLRWQDNGLGVSSTDGANIWKSQGSSAKIGFTKFASYAQLR